MTPSNVIGFLIAWLLPLLLLLLFYLPTRSAWKGAASRTLKVEHAIAPFLASVSVLAIAIPLIANLIQKVSQSIAIGWTVGLFFAAMTLALISLMAGGYLIFKFALESSDGNVQITGERAPTISLAFGGILLFLLTAFAGIFLYVFAQSNSSSEKQTSNRFLVTKQLPKLGTEDTKIVQSWGSPDAQEDNWVSYTTATSTVVFCSKDGQLEQVIETKEEDPNAVAGNC